MTQQRTIGLVQAACTEDTEQNLQHAVHAIGKAADQGAEIVCLQELYRSRYFCQTEDTRRFSLAEAIPGPSTQQLRQLAKNRSIVIVAPLFEKRAEGIHHNTAVVIDADGSIAGLYRKMHIPDDPGFQEKYYFTLGDTGFKSFATRYGQVGVLICWDQWFPEAARLTALSGAQFIFIPTAIGYQAEDAPVWEKQAAAWQTVQRGHSIANGVFLAATNRVGQEDDIRFWGQSFVSDPFGEIIAQASSDNPEILIAQCNLDLIQETRQNWPFLRDRRVDAYGAITRLYNDSND